MVESRQQPRRGRFSTRTATALFGLFAAVVVAGAWFAGQRMDVSSNVVLLLADGDDPVRAKLTRALTTARPIRTWSILTRVVEPQSDTASEAKAAEFGKLFAVALAGRPQFEAIGGRVSQEVQVDTHHLYQRARFAMTSEDATTIPESLSFVGLREMYSQLKLELGGPMSAMIKPMVAQDPGLLELKQLRRLAQAQDPALRVVDEQLVSASGAAVTLVTTRASAFDVVGQREASRVLEEVWAEVSRSEAFRGYQVSRQESAIAKYTLASERLLRGDITMISAFSSLGLLLLVLAVFRSLRVVFVVAVPVISGLAAGLCALLFLGQPVHGLTLAFGATLIGVCVDYPIHIYCHRLLADSPKSERSLQNGLLLGCLTTLIGFIALGVSAFPGMRQLAIFAVVGVSTALLTSLWIVPLALRTIGPCPSIVQAIASQTAGAASVVLARPKHVAAATLTLIACMVAGLSQATFEDHPQQLNAQEPAIAQEDKRVREELRGEDVGRIVVAHAPTLEGALQVNDRISVALAQQVHAGTLAGFRSLHRFLWSQELQLENLVAWENAKQLDGWQSRIEEAATQSGFRPGAMQGYVQAVSQIRAEDPSFRLTFSQLEDSALRDVAALFVVHAEGEYLVLNFLHAVADAEKVRDAVETIPGAAWVDQHQVLRDIYGGNRRATSMAVGIGWLAIFVAIWLRYRRFQLACLMVLAPTLAGGLALAVVSMLGYPLHLLHLICLVLVGSMGVDYSVFLFESRDDRASLRASYLSVLLSCMSTLLSFGLLASSSHPALRSMGLLTGLGVAFALLFAPIVGFFRR